MRDGPRGFDQGSSCPGLLRVPDITDMVARRGLSPSPAPLSSGVPLPIIRESLRPYYPGPASTDPVWAPPRSIATTWGITVVFFSSRYLDVSVRGVGSPYRRDGASHRRVAPFGNPGITGYLLLPRDYRSLSRPSSPPRAQASTVRPYLLPSNHSSFSSDRVKPRSRIA